MKMYLLDPSKEREFKEVSLEELNQAKEEVEKGNLKNPCGWGFNEIMLFEIKDGNLYFKVEEYEC